MPFASIKLPDKKREMPSMPAKETAEAEAKGDSGKSVNRKEKGRTTSEGVRRKVGGGMAEDTFPLVGHLNTICSGNFRENRCFRGRILEGWTRNGVRSTGRFVIHKAKVKCVWMN
jgi:hypothetical protein